MTQTLASSTVEAALAHARRNQSRSVEALAELVRIPSLTGEEGEAQARVADILRAMGAEVESSEPDLELIFERFPNVAQYPTHWRHDLILPYEELPTRQALGTRRRRTIQTSQGRKLG